MNKKMRSSELDGMVYGMLLGDGCIRKHSTGTSNFVLHHSIKQKEYISYKIKLLETISHVKISSWNRTSYNKKVNKYYNSIYAQSNRLIYFRKIYNLFYKDNTKIINNKILNKLTPLGLSIWWQDDGCYYVSHKENKGKERRSYLCTHSFSYEEHLLIQKYFKEKWNINTTIRNDKKQYYFISFPLKEFNKFIEIIEPYIIPSMYYKIDINRIHK